MQIDFVPEEKIKSIKNKLLKYFGPHNLPRFRILKFDDIE
jgi:hypothetical protein